MRLSRRAAVAEFLPPRERHCVDLVGGGAVGDAEAVVFFEPSSLTGAAIFSYAFTESFRQFSFLLKYGCHRSSGWWAGDGGGLVERRRVEHLCQEGIITRKLGEFV